MRSSSASTVSSSSLVSSSGSIVLVLLSAGSSVSSSSSSNKSSTSRYICTKESTSILVSSPLTSGNLGASAQISVSSSGRRSCSDYRGERSCVRKHSNASSLHIGQKDLVLDSCCPALSRSNSRACLIFTGLFRRNKNAMKTHQHLRKDGHLLKVCLGH